MKRGDLVRHMYDCDLHHEGRNHSMWWNLCTGAKAPIPRHQEIPDHKVAEICKQLGIPRPR